MPDENVWLTKIFEGLLSNALGQPQGKWFDRQPGQEAIYAEPKNEFLQSASSGSWKAPLMKMMKYLGEEGGITLQDVAKKAGLSRYESETLQELIKVNRGSSKVKTRKK